jgi:dihydroxyacetone kinase-like predicted kinase
VTRASREVQLNGVVLAKGDWLGLAEGEAVAGGGDFDEVAAAVVDRLLAEPRGLLTVLVGRDGADLDTFLERVAHAYPELEVDVQQGGQPHYPLLLAAE